MILGHFVPHSAQIGSQIEEIYISRQRSIFMFNEELQKILPAALITLVITVELAVLPLLIPISFLMLFVIWGVSIYVLLILCSWLFEINEQKRRIAIGCFLFMIASAAIFIIIVLVKYFTARY